MASDPLQFRPIPPEDLELARELANAIPKDAAAGETFGLERGIPPAPAEMWGIYIKDTVSGVGWLTKSADGKTAAIPALAIGNGWWNLGLGSWLLEKLAAEAKGCEVTVTLPDGETRHALGDMLSEAGFHGPEKEDNETYPAGEWRRRG